jgi:Fe-S cluster assembly iron-binding protein IscA
MFAISDRAVDVIEQALVRSDLPEGAGLRIAAQPETTDGTLRFGAELAPGPEVEDEIVEVEGARVFLDPVASSELEHKVLDAELEPSGGVTFGLIDQDE